MKTVDFFNTHPVFSLDESAQFLDPPGGRASVVERLKYHLKSGRLKRAARGVYAVVPLGVPAERFQPDASLVASAVRPRGVFSYHSALELFGASHSVWNRCTLYVTKRRRPLGINDIDIRFLEYPSPMRTPTCRDIGLRRVEYRGKRVQTLICD